jgi:sec-independent protein translocase protein TatC
LFKLSYHSKAVFSRREVAPFPLILLALGWLGLISSASLRKHRGGVIVFIFVIAMFLTPPDPLSQIVMAVPMCLLYELTLWLIRLKEALAMSAME